MLCGIIGLKIKIKVMNSIASFRKRTLTDKELLKRVDAECDKMYKTNKVPDRYIPVRPDEDFDLLVGKLLIRMNERLKAEEKTRMIRRSCLSL